jgi:hypothetical protein
MSNKKVNSEMLKDLIKEVLEEQRLDEKTYNIKGWKDTSGKKFADLDDTSLSRVSGTGKVVKKGTKKDDYLAVASGGDTPALEPDDLSHPNASSILNKNVETDPAQYSGSSTDGGSFKHGRIVNADGSLSTSVKSSKTGKPNKRLIVSLFKKYENDPTTTVATVAALLKQLSSLFEDDERGPAIDTIVARIKDSGKAGLKLGTAKQSATAVQDIIASAVSVLQAEPTDLTGKAGALGDDPDPYGDYTKMGYQSQIDVDQTSNLSDEDTEKVTRMFDKITIPMNELLKAQVMRRKTDPRTFKVGTTEITSLEEMAVEFQTVATAMNPKSSGALKFLTTDESLMLMTKISYVSSLFAIAKQMPQGQEAGYVWEKMSAVFLGGLVAGKKGEMADVITNLYSGTSISQKFIKGDIEQASTNITNLMKLKEKGDDIYYLALIKGGGSSAAGLNKIYFALLKLTVSNKTSGNFDTSYYDKSGKFVKIATNKNAGTTAGKKYTLFATNTYLKKLPTLDLGLPADMSLDDTMSKLSDNLSKPSGTFGELSRSVIAIASKLSEMKNVTAEYRNARAALAATGGTFSSKNSSQEYADKIANTYVSVKADYKTLFKKLGNFGIGTAAETTFKEGKKITSKMLKKIIQETLKK